MSTINYEELRKIEMEATKKLLKYISKEMQFEEVLDTIDFPYPDFGEDKYRLAFTSWVSTDYTLKNGSTFIDKYLKHSTTKLTEEEREILIKRNQSHISLFEIIFTDDLYIKAIDLLQHKTYDIMAPDLSILSIGDLVFARISEVFGTHIFIGNISYLPPSTRNIFIEDVFVNFNSIRMKNNQLNINSYLKNHSLNVYAIYTNCIQEAMEMDDDIVSDLYDELDEFDFYLQLKHSRDIIKKHMTNLMEFFEYYLADNDLTLYDIDLVDFDLFLNDSIQDGFITAQEDLNSYIGTFKAYLQFLSNKNPEYKEAYIKVLDISKRRFEYMDRLTRVKSPFRINKKISNAVRDELNNESVALLLDFDKFLLYIIDKPLELTKKNKYIKKLNLEEMNQILDSSTYIDKKIPNQKDYFIIHLFYRFGLSLGLISTEDNLLTIRKKGTNYLRLNDEDKYALFFQYIWDSQFIMDNLKTTNKSVVESLKDNILNILYQLEINKNYLISDLVKDFSINPRLFFEYYEYLKSLGIINCTLYPNYEIAVTNLGKILGSFLKFYEDANHKGNIVELRNYKR